MQAILNLDNNTHHLGFDARENVMDVGALYQNENQLQPQITI
jgi:hypothetical protein